MIRRALTFASAALQHGCGRTLAVVLLLALAVMQALPALSPLSPFSAAQQFLFDSYQRVFPRERHSAPVTIVAVDEASLKQVGQWPWPRNRDADLVRRIAAMKPLAIGLDIYMPENDMTSPEAVARNLPQGASALAQALRQLPAHDTRLAAAIRDAPVVLGAAGFDFETLSTTRGLISQPLRIKGEDPLPWLHDYPFVLASLPQLQAAATGQAILSVDLKEGVVRRIPLLVAVNGQPTAALALEMLRVATGSAAVEAVVDRRGVKAVNVADLSVPTQAQGDVWLHFAHSDLGHFVSAADVLAGRVAAEQFADKIVLVGLTGNGLIDLRATPLRENLPGIEIQAQLIESFFDGRFLLRPFWLPWLEAAVLLACGGLLVWLTPRLPPRRASLVAAALSAGYLAAGFVLFQFTGLLVDAASVFLGSNIVFAGLLGGVYVETDRQRREAEASLHQARESAARAAGELDAARRIQLGSLPVADEAFPGETRFHVAAKLEPARAVGGDLYDFFMLDDAHLFFLIGDVTGKGVPASLFMVVAKALSKSAALRGTQGTRGIDAIMSIANREIARDNPARLFVTSVAGILNVDTGEVELVVAGHDPPWRVSPQGVTKIEAEGGLPLCIVDDFDYPVTRFQLAPGDALCLTTDGITEAMNAAKELYGSERLAAALQRVPQPATAQALLDAVREDVRRFVDTAEPWDDLTLMVLRFS